MENEQNFQKSIPFHDHNHKLLRTLLIINRAGSGLENPHVSHVQYVLPGVFSRPQLKCRDLTTSLNTP